MPRLKKIKAESFDLMQYFYRSVHEPLIHAMIQLSGRLDQAALIRAVTKSSDFIPILRCRFKTRNRRPQWEDCGFTGVDMVHVVEADPREEDQAGRLLASVIDVAREPQLKIFILRGPETDTLCVVMNHMVCDGGGFKEYLYLLSGLYTRCLNSLPLPELRPAPRGIGQILSNFSLREKVSILRSEYETPRQKKQGSYCLQGDSGRPFFVTRRIEREDYFKIRAAAKTHSATLNDAILTAYCRVLSRETRQKKITIPCPVDLRKYLKPGGKHGICNLTSNYICSLVIDGQDTFEETLRQVSGQMKRQKSKPGCLKPLLLLRAVFHILPFRILQKAFGKLFTIPVLSYTNLGIIDKDNVDFGGLAVTDMYITGAVKYVPYFQIAASTFDDRLTLSSNLYGTPDDQRRISEFLKEVRQELLINDMSVR